MKLKSLSFDKNDTLVIEIADGEAVHRAQVMGRVVGPAFRQHEVSIREVVEAVLAAIVDSRASQAARNEALGGLLRPSPKEVA